jgi:hypothetical protein
MFTRIDRSSVALAVILAAPPLLAQSDPLPSWNEGAARTAILEFVERVSKPGSADFVPEAERIAVFDNDGTLWVEQPMYVQGMFAFDRVRTLAPQHPEWKEQQPFKAVLEGDMKTALAGGERSLLEIVMATHAGMTTADFEGIVKDWIAKAEHPRFNQLHLRCVYQPMLELMAYLRNHGFQTWIVSGGGIDFMRPWTEEVYGVPPQQVIGSSIKTQFQMRGNDEAVLMRLPDMNFVDDKDGKPVGIQSHIGRRPIAAFGNSDGDLQMLQWATGGKRPGFALYVHHTDAEREYAYDRKSPIGKLDQGLDAASRRGWTVVDMKRDWKVIFPFETR